MWRLYQSDFWVGAFLVQPTFKLVKQRRSMRGAFGAARGRIAIAGSAFDLLQTTDVRPTRDGRA